MLRPLFFLPLLASGIALDLPLPAQTAKETRVKNQKPALPPGVRVLKDLPFAQRESGPLLLDLYLPEKPPAGSLPAVMWVHGGGWRGGSKERCPGAWLAAEGYAVASISYRLIPEHTWPAQIEDCRAALRWIRQQGAAHGLDGSRIAAWGGSAGGHLAALLGTADAAPEERVQAVIDWYGPSDLLTMPPNMLSEKRTREDLAKANGALLLGGIVMDRPQLARAASALHQAGAGDAPFLIMHGSADPAVPLDQSQRLHARLREAGVPSSLHVLAGAGHGGKEFSTPEANRQILDFLNHSLKPASP